MVNSGACVARIRWLVIKNCNGNEAHTGTPPHATTENNYYQKFYEEEVRLIVL
jgi:hypothetical protein